MMKNHIRFCNTEECKCRDLQLECDETLSPVGGDSPTAEKKVREHGTIVGYKDDVRHSQSAYLQEKYKGLESSVYEILNLTLRHMKRKDSLSEGEIIQAYVNYHMLSRMFNSLYNLMLAEEYDLTLFQQFQLYCLR